jgi:hypothetical protein
MVVVSNVRNESRKYTRWSKTLCTPADYSTKNTQIYFKQFQSLTMVKPHQQCNITEHHIQDVLRTKTRPALEHRPHNWARRHHASGRTPKFCDTQHPPKKTPLFLKRDLVPPPPPHHCKSTERCQKHFFLSENPKGSNMKMATRRNM